MYPPQILLARTESWPDDPILGLAGRYAVGWLWPIDLKDLLYQKTTSYDVIHITYIK